MPKLSRLNQVFILEVILFVLIVTSIVPRWCAFILAGILILYTILAPLEDAVILFVRSIPLFIALPITQHFDNFNTWRILALLIFLRWAWKEATNRLSSKASRSATGASEQGGILAKINARFAESLLGALLLISLFSVLVAGDKHLAILRIIYFINLSFVPIVIYHLDIKDRIMRNIAIPVLIAAAVGFIQLILTYFIDIYQFIGFWGEGIQCRQFGMEWCYIATHVGNTWFAYFGEQLSLRVFSLFTDSHTFPIFLLLGLPSLFLLKSESTRKKYWWVAIAFVYLAIILSGTRGIWAASLGVFIWALLLWLWFKKPIPTAKSLALFFALFIIAWPIFNSPQFLLAHGGFGHRIKSVFDFDETSNKARIAIWKASVVSISHHPVLGVGIGNFPVVLSENLELSKAGSSAHNLYLHIAAEMGIFALLAFLWFMVMVMRRLYSLSGVYFESMLLFLPWVFVYVLTDVALFDERAFLITATVIALILSYGTTTRQY